MSDVSHLSGAFNWPSSDEDKLDRLTDDIEKVHDDRRQLITRKKYNNSFDWMAPATRFPYGVYKFSDIIDSMYSESQV